MITGSRGLLLLTLCGEVICRRKRPLFSWVLCSHQPTSPKSSILSHMLWASQSHHTRLILQQKILSCAQKQTPNNYTHENSPTSQFHSITQLLYSQNFHLESVHPPNVSVEDEVVHLLPVLPVLLYRFGHDDAVLNAVHCWIV